MLASTAPLGMTCSIHISHIIDRQCRSISLKFIKQLFLVVKLYIEDIISYIPYAFILSSLPLSVLLLISPVDLPISLVFYFSN